jgi:hypothetical protein
MFLLRLIRGGKISYEYPIIDRKQDMLKEIIKLFFLIPNSYVFALNCFQPCECGIGFHVITLLSVSHMCTKYYLNVFIDISLFSLYAFCLIPLEHASGSVSLDQTILRVI